MSHCSIPCRIAAFCGAALINRPVGQPKFVNVFNGLAINGSSCDKYHTRVTRDLDSFLATEI